MSELLRFQTVGNVPVPGCEDSEFPGEVQVKKKKKSPLMNQAPFRGRSG